MALHLKHLSAKIREMKFLSKIKNALPSAKSAILAVSSAILLIFAFPNFEFWFIAWFALIPLFIAIETEKASFAKSFLTGWLFGTVFFFGSTWWLTFAPITYAGVPTLLAYFLLFLATSVAGLYPALFSGVFSLCLKRFGHWGVFSAPFIWTATEFLRLWTTGNNWNAVGYSQAFSWFVEYASFGGVFFISFCVIFFNSYILWTKKFFYKALGIENLSEKELETKVATSRQQLLIIFEYVSPILILLPFIFIPKNPLPSESFQHSDSSKVIAVQPNVPMSGLNQTKWRELRQRQVELAEKAIDDPTFPKPKDSGDKEAEDHFYKARKKSFDDAVKVVILPESPMNFQYEQDSEFRNFINDFAKRNNVSVLFNSAEPDKRKDYGYFNSAVLINEKGEEVSQYDKIYLLPFGEKVPLPESIEWIVPTMVGRFSSGEEYDLLPFGDAKAGVMICFESHFPSLAREYARNGADVLIEMTNDGYLGNTPVLRQHLASAVFRAVETNRPVLRVTNVGVTAYVNESGEVLDEAPVYAEATKIWSVKKSDGWQTIYVKYGEWFAWFCSIVSLCLLVFCIWTRKEISRTNDSE